MKFGRNKFLSCRWCFCQIALIFVSVILFVQVSQAKPQWVKKPVYCQIVDNSVRPLYQFKMDIFPSADFESYGKSALWGYDGYWDLAYFRDVMASDIDISLETQGLMFRSSTALKLPDHLNKTAVNAEFTWRLDDGYSIRTSVEPGIYSELLYLNGDSFFCPFSLSLIRSFRSDLSGIAGLRFRPRFNTLVMPILGVVWEPSSTLRVEALLPESKVMYFVNSLWTTYAGLSWVNESFASSEDYGIITYEDFRIHSGVTRYISDQVSVSLDVGYAFSRSVDTEDGAEGSVGADDKTFIRVGVGGPF